MDWERQYRNSAHCLGLLALCFLTGAVLGQVLAAGMPEAAEWELRRYFLERREGDVFPAVKRSSVLAAAALYVRYPLLALLLSLTSLGGILLCGTAALLGFLLSFAVGCFTAVFGTGGVAVAAAAMGIRCLVTLPCFFLLAVPAMETSASLLRPRRLAPDRREWRYCLLFCAAALALGVFADLLLTPGLLRWALRLVLRG